MSGRYACEKMLKIGSHEGSANKNHSKKALHIYWNG